MDRLPDLDAIESFLMVAENLSFRRAAVQLNLDQSALSRRIKDLESRVGATLFHRTTREVSLTQAGQAFYESNAQLMESLRDAVSLARRTASGASGRLRIGYMTFAAIAAMPERVRAFRAVYPDVSVELLYHRTQAQKIELARRRLDLGFMIGPFHNADMATAPIASERLVAVLPGAHPEAANPALTLETLSRLPLIMGTMAEWDLYRQMLQTVFADRALPMDVAFEASSTTGILGLVAAGLGGTVFPESIGRICPANTVARPIADCETRIDTILAWPRHAATKPVLNFLDLCGIAP